MQLWITHNPARACFVSADGYETSIRSEPYLLLGQLAVEDRRGPWQLRSRGKGAGQALPKHPGLGLQLIGDAGLGPGLAAGPLQIVEQQPAGLLIRKSGKELGTLPGRQAAERLNAGNIVRGRGFLALASASRRALRLGADAEREKTKQSCGKNQTARRQM